MTLYTLVAAGGEAYEIKQHMFGVNIIGEINESTGTPNHLFSTTIGDLGITRLRYPAGKVGSENITELDHTKNGTSKLRPDLVEYLDWVKATQTETTLVLPALEDKASSADIREWAELVMEHMGNDAELIVAYEIGNEYWGSADEVEYGSNAQDIIEALSDSMSGDAVSHEPGIWVQTANPAGGSSNYNNGKPGSITDDDAVRALSTWASSDRPNDWQPNLSASQYYNSLGSFERNIIKANLELLEQLDGDRDITNGFQAGFEGLSVDGIVAHYYYNKSHDEFGGDHAAWQSNYLNHRFSVWEAMLPQEIEIQITEWNVQAGNSNETGMKAAGVVQEQFQSMLEMGVDGADFWALRHNTFNSIAGDHRDETPISLTPSGYMLKYMSQSLAPGSHGKMTTLDVSGYERGDVEINAYEGDYKTVIYVTSRSNDFNQEIYIDISGITDGVRSWSGRKVGIDPTTSDGLSEHWGYYENGQKKSGTRLSKREISNEERDALRELLGVELADKHIIYDQDRGYITYLPNVEGIIPKAKTPSSLDDFYFATESDVRGLETKLSQQDLGSNVENLSIELDPFEFVEITVETTQRIGGGNTSEKLVGGWGRDVVFARAGNDKMYGKQDADRLFGGNGSDVIFGGNGNDIIKGGKGSDAIFGGNGNDRINGGNGNDIIRGGKGKDVMTGSAGEDIFVFNDGDLLKFDSSHRKRLDKINDFTIGNDKIRMDLDGVDDLGDLKMWRDNANEQFIIAVRETGDRILLEGDYLWSEMHSATNFDFL